MTSSLTTSVRTFDFDTDPAPSRKVTPAQVDAQLDVLHAYVNQIKAVLDSLLRSDDTIQDGYMRSRMLHPEVLTAFNLQNSWQIKVPCRVAAPGNINIASPGATIDGVTMVSGDRVMLPNQTAGAQNGIYVWNGAAAAMTRAADADTAAELARAYCVVTAGNTLVETGWQVQNATITTLGVDVIVIPRVTTQDVTFPIPIARGGTGATTAPAALTALGVSAFGQTLVDDADANAARTTLGIPSQSMAARTVIANDTAGAANGAARNIDDLTVLADSSTARRDMSERFADIVYLKDFGATGDGVTDDTAAVQAWATYGATNKKLMFAQPGLYRLSAAITFPNTSFAIIGSGPTETQFKPMASATGIYCFDLSGCNGPAKVIRGIGFEGPAFGVYGSGAAIRCNSTNGLYLDNVWMRGINSALLVTSSSFINCNQCVAEYCFVAVDITNACDETIMVGWTMYRNETDLRIAGAQKSLIFDGMTLIATKTDGLLITGSGVVASGIVAQDDSSGYTPNIINITGADNLISGVRVKSFGLRGVFLQGSGATRNRFSDIIVDGASTGILISAGVNNSFNGITLRSCATQGIRSDAGARNRFLDFFIDGCGYGISINALDLEAFYSGRITASVTADWHQSAVNTGRLIIDNVESNFAGISSVTYLMKLTPAGNYVISTPTIPVAVYPFTAGDIAFDTSPTAGDGVGWICTASGSPGTWVRFGFVDLSGSATYDPASLADGDGATTTVTVTGAALGDFAQASFSLDLQGITLTAWVSSANTVSVRFQNESGGTLDLASGTLRARVRKQ